MRPQCDAARRRYADYLYGVLVRNTEQLSAARPSGSPAALSNGAGKRSSSAAHGGGKKGAGKEFKRQAQAADARHSRELAQVPWHPPTSGASLAVESVVRGCAFFTPRQLPER